MRLAPLGLTLLFSAAACESPPAFPVPSGPPVAVALDVELARYVLGTWTIDGFSEELAHQLAKYNVKVVDARAAPTFVALIDLGKPENRRAIDVFLEPGGERAPEPELAGRVAVTDLSQTTLEAAAQLVAPIIARKVWALDRPAGGYPGPPP